MVLATDTRKGKVLVVDDEAPIRRSIRRGLASAGYDCLEMGDSQEAMTCVQSENPDLVILDIMMPGKSGCELLPEIVESRPGVAVIMSTAVIDIKTIINCMKLGALDYITKPFEVEDIVQSVDKALQMKRLEKSIEEYHKQLEHTVESQKSKTREVFLNSMEALVNALEAKDNYTAGHSRRVTNLSIAIGQKMGLPEDTIEDLRWGALLHDVGKIAIDPAIQNKVGELTTEEYRHMMTHAMIGAGIVKSVASEAMIDIIVHHHDHFDGSGIDQCIKGENIPLAARIVSVADSFDAMTSDRPYRRALSIEAGITEIKRCTGTQFDPAIVNAFLKLDSTDLLVASNESCRQSEDSK